MTNSELRQIDIRNHYRSNGVCVSSVTLSRDNKKQFIEGRFSFSAPATLNLDECILIAQSHVDVTNLIGYCMSLQAERDKLAAQLAAIQHEVGR